MGLRIASARASSATDQDRLGTFGLHEGKLLVVADGSGGIAGGRDAAESVIGFFEQRLDRFTDPHDPATWSIALADLDLRILDEPKAGETTAVVVFASDEQVVGASVGDTEAWLLRAAQIRDLTEAQHRKPRLGSGCAVPIPFGPAHLRGRLLIATDGLFHFSERRAIASAAQTGSIEVATISLVEATKMRDGAVQDDVTVLLCETDSEGRDG